MFAVFGQLLLAVFNSSFQPDLRKEPNFFQIFSSGCVHASLIFGNPPMIEERQIIPAVGTTDIMLPLGKKQMFGTEQFVQTQKLKLSHGLCISRYSLN